MSLWILAIIAAVALLPPATLCVKIYNTGDGTTVHRLNVEQDVWLESPNRNYNNYQWLLVARHPRYPNKRFLVQFENLSSGCNASKIKWAKMYLYFAYAHKASFVSMKEAPWISRHLEVYMVKKRWKETETTSKYRLRGVPWGKKYLGRNGWDAGVCPQGAVTISSYRPAGFVEFDITCAMKSWAYGATNYGVLVRATNEHAAGRDIRFFSKSYKDVTKHAFVNVLCDKSAKGPGRPPVTRPVRPTKPTRSSRKAPGRK